MEKSPGLISLTCFLKLYFMLNFDGSHTPPENYATHCHLSFNLIYLNNLKGGSGGSTGAKGLAPISPMNTLISSDQHH